MDHLRKLFIDHIIWAYECLEMQGIMAEYGIREVEGIWNRIGTIIAEYAYLQVAKMHDSAGSKKNKNLSLDWFVYDCVDTSGAKQSYRQFLKDNQEFINAVKRARHKVVSHSDQDTYKRGDRVGAYDEGLDEQYFSSLHKLISGCYQEKGWGVFPEWPPFIQGDTERFMKKFSKDFTEKQV